jgi:hypothetical protein
MFPTSFYQLIGFSVGGALMIYMSFLDHLQLSVGFKSKRLEAFETGHDGNRSRQVGKDNVLLRAAQTNLPPILRASA